MVAAVCIEPQTRTHAHYTRVQSTQTPKQNPLFISLFSTYELFQPNPRSLSLKVRRAACAFVTETQRHQRRQRPLQATYPPSRDTQAQAQAPSSYSSLEVWDVGVAFVSLDDIAEFNHTYRGKSEATDVRLSAPAAVVKPQQNLKQQQLKLPALLTFMLAPRRVRSRL